MTGLMWKDLLIMRKTLKSYALFLAFYGVLAVLGVFDLSFVTAMIQVIIMMLPISAFSYDELAKWDRYAMTLPLGRRAVVGGRYLFTLVMASGAALLGLLACLALSVKGGHESLVENIITVLTSLAVGLLIADILLPLCYKLGPERARPYLYVVVFLPIILLFGAYKLGFFQHLDLTAFNSLSDAATLGLFALLPLASLAGLGIAFLLSCRIMDRKEV